MANYKEYYLNQIKGGGHADYHGYYGNQFKGSGLPVFVGYPNQRGNCIGVSSDDYQTGLCLFSKPMVYPF